MIKIVYAFIMLSIPAKFLMVVSRDLGMEISDINLFHQVLRLSDTITKNSYNLLEKYDLNLVYNRITYDLQNTEKVVILLDECRNMELSVLPPDVNQGEYYFTVNDADEIIYGLGAVRGVDHRLVECAAHAARRNKHVARYLDQSTSLRWTARGVQARHDGRVEVRVRECVREWLND